MTQVWAGARGTVIRRHRLRRSTEAGGDVAKRRPWRWRCLWASGGGVCRCVQGCLQVSRGWDTVRLWLGTWEVQAWRLY